MCHLRAGAQILRVGRRSHTFPSANSLWTSGTIHHPVIWVDMRVLSGALISFGGTPYRAGFGEARLPEGSITGLPLSRLSINQATVREQWDLSELIGNVAALGIGGIAPWRDKLAITGVEKARQEIRTAGLRVSSLCRGGMFPAETTPQRQAAIDDCLRAIDEAAAIGAEALVIVAGGLPAGSKDIAGARSMVVAGLEAALPHARACGIPLAIEPLHPMYAADRACINTLHQANDLCDHLGDGVGVIVDVYHLWWDPALEHEIQRASGRILGFHISDWLVPTRHMLLDRGMMGDGIIDVAKIWNWVAATGYDGLIEIEIFSVEDWWTKPGEIVLQTCVDRFRTCLG